MKVFEIRVRCLVVVAAVCFAIVACDGKAQQAAVLEDIYQQVVDDSIVQYNMVKRQGSAIDLCVHAGLVSAAYLQAKDEPHYASWKQTERTDCAAAGMPQQ
ncbi:hypothetical protein A3K87_05040 [Variovorax paradoxus]|uniref:Lipoprotein n=1 Tax=Variovorax paradoxus TaxID=34073 RepID=A0AA91ID50_VARPD|nr:hypothetical protein [Variovorax paradoxus]OAK66912.1 hypothetical protein A3K87_05040 [Variovorax paradoxus]